MEDSVTIPRITVVFPGDSCGGSTGLIDLPIGGQAIGIAFIHLKYSVH
jgi:hypothetical protein